MTLAMSFRATFLRAPRKSHSVAAPNDTRSQVISPGSNESKASAMNRNDEPQIAPIDRNSAHSPGVNAWRFEPCDVERIRREPAPCRSRIEQDYGLPLTRRAVSPRLGARG